MAGGRQPPNGAIGGLVGGVVGDGLQQAAANLPHWRCGYSMPELLASGALGAVLGGVGGRWVSRSGCFAAGTPVRMADGTTKPVEQIHPGDRVQSRDPATGVVSAKRVVRTFVHTVDHTLLLTLPSGEQIETTELHPFYVEGRGFVEAGKLGIGTAIVTRAGPALAVTRTERGPGPVQVYNFEVEGFHTYFVGRSGGGVWVHNAGLCDPVTTAEWHQGSYDSPEEAAWNHFERHMDDPGVNAEDFWDYEAKAQAAFRRHYGKGDPVEGYSENVLRYRVGANRLQYIDLFHEVADDGTVAKRIVSFGGKR